MANTEQGIQDLLDRVAALHGTVVRERIADELVAHPGLADALVKQINELLEAVVTADDNAPPPPDKGLAQLVGIGPEAAGELGVTRLPHGVEAYDESVASERLNAVADLYYIYQHERIGVFRAIQKLQELFRAGSVMLSSGTGAYGLYQFDRREVLRYTRRDRLSAYRKAFGYGTAAVPAGSRANTDFHRLLTHFTNEVALFWRDKRISDVMRERAYDPSFGSMAVVRRSGLDLRNNLKFMSYGHLNVLRVEVMQLLDEAFRVLGSDDVKRLFGADTAWDVVESILTQHFNERLVSSPRQRMAVAGREVVRWLAQPHVLQTQRAQFEALLLQIAEYAEEWLTSAQSLGLAQRSQNERMLRRDTRPLPLAGRPAGTRAPLSPNGAPVRG
ncbi:MAG TPA: hypothetical protein VGR06_24155 [Actinophytocola sp.]|jgi:hypothetical protein|uniref:hypothetical protein n=1 Tax=Actinophytocola sp. TaxID=1872138 RepID=UPI002E02877E|nr:hypothetical protein [Actinophytocola sp.]